ncbi:hypothetical protein AC579_3510 [Pseudocercospora musae]|uniref:Carboxylesterase type B domain-containing protein n=1 Tax=Pseudocercospora musae TaxID=113226 RepID=A0A139I3D7_9PEZI|nr:hypothetical protein AC579_3510 [Pseudocercospora musae]
MDFLPTPRPMATIDLPQGTYRGIERDGILTFHNVPYAAPFKRFRAPEPPAPSRDIHDATVFGAVCPQKPSRLTIVTGPMPSTRGHQDEYHCNVLSIYAPIASNDDRAPLPIICFAHGGGFMGGGSQVSWYDGSRFAKDADAIVICINYRLGAFGNLQTGDHQLPCATQDVVRALEWARDNARAFGGDPENVTAFGQGAGAVHMSTMLHIRPDLLRRAIIQSRPGGIGQTAAKQHEVRAMMNDALPHGVTLESATTDQLLEAQTRTIMASPGMLPPFLPTVSEDHHKPTKRRFQVLIGWNKGDCSCLAKLSNMDLKSGETFLTHTLVKHPSTELADILRKNGHDVTLFELSWSGEGCELGAVQCIDLPMVFGTEEAWKAAPMLGKTPWEEWERRGKILRMAWGAFARDGTKPKSREGLTVS